MQVDKFLAAAKKGDVTVVFEKINDGGTRRMHCTLNEKVSGGVVNESMGQQPSSDHIVVWALDKSAWRSFRVSTVIEWYEGKTKCPHCNGDKTQPHKNCILR